MRVSSSALWPDRADSALGLNHWAELAGKLAKEYGALPLPPRPVMLGIRGVEVGADVTHQPVHRPSFDDTGVLLVSGYLPYVFPISTHAWQKNSKLSPGGNVGSIRVGHYVLHLRAGKYPCFEVTLPNGDKNLPAHRDTDHDGVISEAEAARSEARETGPQVNAGGDYANAVLFHAVAGHGAPDDVGHVSSIACQTCELRWLQIMADHGGNGINYFLVNAPHAVELVSDNGDSDRAPPENVA